MQWRLGKVFVNKLLLTYPFWLPSLILFSFSPKKKVKKKKRGWKALIGRARTIIEKEVMTDEITYALFKESWPNHERHLDFFLPR